MQSLLTRKLTTTELVVELSKRGVHIQGNLLCPEETVSADLQEAYQNQIPEVLGLLALLQQCDSPIEENFACCLYEWAVSESIAVGTKSNSLIFRPANYQYLLMIRPQGVISKYRVDFELVLTHKTGSISRVIVETDGKEFHDRTWLQGHRDRQRDRALAKATNGITPILRFSGTEIHRNLFGCIKEVAEFLLISQAISKQYI